MLNNLRLVENGKAFLKPNEYGMAIPCSPHNALVFDRPTSGTEYDVCPVCGKKIWAEADRSIVGHEIDDIDNGIENFIEE